MNKHSHRTAQALIQTAGDITMDERGWLQVHLANCRDCRAYSAMHDELSVGLPLAYAPAPLSKNDVYGRLEQIRSGVSGRAKWSGLSHLSRGVAFVALALVFLLVMLAIVPGLLPDPAPLPLTDATRTPQPLTATPIVTPDQEATVADTALPTEATTAPTVVQTEAPVLPLSPSPFQPVSQLGGSMRGIVMQGDRAFVGMGPRIAAIDLSNPAGPQLISAGPPFQGMVNALVPLPESPNTLVAAAGKRLVTVDGSDPVNIVPLHALELPGGIITLALDPENHILYAAGETTSQPSRTRSYVASVRVGPDGALELLDQENMGTQFTSLAVGQGVLYLGADQTSVGVYAMPLEQPGALSAPRGVIASSPEVYRAGYRLHATRDRLYVGSYDALFAYDIREPLKPVELWKEPAMMAMDFVFDGDRVLLYGWQPAGSFLPFHRAIALPEPYRGPAMGISSSDVALHRGRFIVAQYHLGVFDTQTEDEPALLGSYRSPLDGILGAASDDEQAYVIAEGMPGAVSDFTLHVLRLPDLVPLSETTIPNPGGWGGADWFRGIMLEGERLYVAGMDGVTIFDTSTTAPARLGFLPVGDMDAMQYLQAIAATEREGLRLLFTAHSNSSGSSILTVYDLTSPTSPQQIGRSLVLAGESIGRMLTQPQGDLLYFTSVIGADSFMRSMRFEGSALAAESQTALPAHPMAFVVQDDHLVVGTADEMIVFSTTDPQNPRQVGRLSLPGYARGVLLLEGRALATVGVTYGQDVLIEFDLSDPANPRMVSLLDIPFSSGLLSNWQTGERYLVLAGYSSGVQVLERRGD